MYRYTKVNPIAGQINEFEIDPNVCIPRNTNTLRTVPGARLNGWLFGNTYWTGQDVLQDINDGTYWML